MGNGSQLQDILRVARLAAPRRFSMNWISIIGCCRRAADCKRRWCWPSMRRG